MKLSEARMLADHCIELGVPSDQLVLDEDAQNTGQNITHSALLVGRVDSAVLIHKPYMTRRFLPPRRHSGQSRNLTFMLLTSI